MLATLPLNVEIARDVARFRVRSIHIVLLVILVVCFPARGQTLLCGTNPQNLQSSNCQTASSFSHNDSMLWTAAGHAYEGPGWPNPQPMNASPDNPACSASFTGTSSGGVTITASTAPGGTGSYLGRYDEGPWVWAGDYVGWTFPGAMYCTSYDWNTGACKTASSTPYLQWFQGPFYFDTSTTTVYGNGSLDANTALLGTTNGTGPVQLSFSQSLGAFGTDISTLSATNFTAALTAYNGTTLLGTYYVNATGYGGACRSLDSTPSNGGTGCNNAPFIGIGNVGPITKVLLSVTDNSTGAPTGFAIDTLLLQNAPPPPAPTIASLAPPSGPVGTSVTISGSNFGSPQGASTVTFNGTNAGIAANWTGNTIVITVPSGATTGNVVVTVGGQASNPVSFTVIAPPSPPSITSLSVTSGPVGTSVTITGSNFGASQGSSTVTFNGTNAGMAASWSPTTIVAAVPSGAATGNVVVTIGGLASNPVSFTVMSIVAFASLPAGLSVSVDGVSSTTPCNFQWIPGSTHTIAASGPQSGGVGIQYVFASWSDAGAASHTITVPASPTTYTANFATQYYLTTSATSGGSISPQAPGTTLELR